MADFRFFDIEISLPLQIFDSSDRIRKDEQKTPYKLPSKEPLEFSKNYAVYLQGFYQMDKKNLKG